jgi:hypothetical protein
VGGQTRGTSTLRLWASVQDTGPRFSAAPPSQNLDIVSPWRPPGARCNHSAQTYSPYCASDNVRIRPKGERWRRSSRLLRSLFKRKDSLHPDAGTFRADLLASSASTLTNHRTREAMSGQSASAAPKWADVWARGDRGGSTCGSLLYLPVAAKRPATTRPTTGSEGQRATCDHCM